MSYSKKKKRIPSEEVRPSVVEKEERRQKLKKRKTAPKDTLRPDPKPGTLKRGTKIKRTISQKMTKKRNKGRKRDGPPRAEKKKTHGHTKTPSESRKPSLQNLVRGRKKGGKVKPVVGGHRRLVTTLLRAQGPELK